MKARRIQHLGDLVLAVLFLLPDVIVAETRITLSTNLSDVTQVRANQDSVVFLSPEGAVVLDRPDLTWRFSLAQKHPAPFLSDEDYWQRPVDRLYPRQANSKTYMSVLSRTPDGSTEILLTATAGEGAVFDRHCVVDTLARKAYSFDLNRIMALDVDRDTIWMGHRHGIMEVDRTSGARKDYVVLPTINENSSTLIDESRLWVTLDGVGIEAISIRGGGVRFWPVKELFATAGSPEGSAVFSNFVQDSDNVYVACHFVRGGNWLVRGQSYLLAYALRDKSWTVKRLVITEGRQPLDAISIIRLDEMFPYKIWLGANHMDVLEDEWVGFGGLYVYELSREVVYPIDDVDRRHLIARLDYPEAQLRVEVYGLGPGRKRIYHVSQEGVVVVSDSLGLRESALATASREGKGAFGLGAVPERLRQLQFVPRVVQIDESQVEVRKY